MSNRKKHKTKHCRWWVCTTCGEAVAKVKRKPEAAMRNHERLRGCPGGYTMEQQPATAPSSVVGSGVHLTYELFDQLADELYKKG